MPKFLMVVTSSSKISLHARIWPFAFFTFFRRERKYQNLDFARVSSVLHSFMRYTWGSGIASVGTWRPTMWN